MPFVNRNDFIDGVKNNQKPTNWIDILDKFFNNDKVQKSIFSIIEKFKKPEENKINNPPLIQETNIKNNEEIVKSFVNRLCEMGQGKRTIEELDKEFKK